MTSLLLCTCGLLLLALGSLAMPAVTSNSTDPDYAGYQVLEILTKNKTEDMALNSLLQALDDKVDVWGRAGVEGRPTVVMVGPDTLAFLTSALDSLAMQHRVYIRDVQAYLGQEAHERKRRATLYNYPSQTVDPLQQYTTRFNSYDQTMKFLELIDASKTKQANTELITLATTFEGRNIRLIKLSENMGRIAAKPAIFIDAGIHAREWIAPATVINFIYQLAENPNNDPQVAEMLQQFDFYILPLLNPDGYEYSRTHNRMWRKNRNPTNSYYCPGVDLNRNFDFHWDPRNGASSNPCSDVYAGPSPLSEAESRALAAFLNARSSSIALYLTYHSSGQFFLYPWGYTTALPSDANQLESLARAAIGAISGYSYTTGSAANVLEPAAGGSDDYAKGVSGIKFSYTVELPPRNVNFIMPESEIPAVADTSFEGLQAMTRELARILRVSSTLAPQVFTPTTTPPTTTTARIGVPWAPNSNIWQLWYQWFFGNLQG